MTTASIGNLENGGTEHGPPRLNVPGLPRDMGKVLPDVGVEIISVWGLCQTIHLGLPGRTSTVGANTPLGGDQFTAPPHFVT